MITLIDNYDSFTYNLFHDLSKKDDVMVIKNDQIFNNFNKIIDSKAVIISPGPSTPFNSGECLELVNKIYSFIPILGVCLGHQILARACNISTYKLHNGHRGINHPVLNLNTGKGEITSQNHGFAVDYDTAISNSSVKISHKHLNDQTVAGLEIKGKNCFSVQYHPEAGPGPNDGNYLFDQFLSKLK